MSGDEVPLIRINAGELPRMVTQALEALDGDANLYVRGTDLVTVAREPERPTEQQQKLQDGLVLRPGTPRVSPLGWATLLERLATVARWERYDPNERTWRASHPDRLIVSVLLAKPEREMLRPLDSIFESPFFRADGNVVQTQGYDRSSACVYLPSGQFPTIADAPSRDDARAALAELREPFEDFPFAGTADKDVPIAALLSIIARPAIAGPVPGFLLDASTRGSGKSLIANVVSAIAAGRPAPLGTWPDSEEELEKVLGSYAIAGVGVVLFDDVTTAIHGGPLNKVLTAPDRVALRVLGRSEQRFLPWRCVMFFTGNNLETRGDTERRVLQARLEPAEERPEDRVGFRHSNLLAWATQERARLLAAGLTILRAYSVAGRPSSGLRWGSFEAWTDLVASAILWAGGANVLATRPTQRGTTDPARAAHLTILEHWPRLDPTGEGLTIATVKKLLYPERFNADPIPEAPYYGEVREALETLALHKSGRGIDPNLLGFRFRKMRDRWVEGARLELNEDNKARGGAARWRVRVMTYDGGPMTFSDLLGKDSYPVTAIDPADRISLDEIQETPPPSGTVRAGLSPDQKRG